MNISKNKSFFKQTQYFTPLKNKKIIYLNITPYIFRGNTFKNTLFLKQPPCLCKIKTYICIELINKNHLTLKQVL